MNKEAYSFGFVDELQKMARVTVPEPGWSRQSGSRFWHRGSEIAEKRPTRTYTRRQNKKRMERLKTLRSAG